MKSNSLLFLVLTISLIMMGTLHNTKLAIGTVQFGLNYGISNNVGQTDFSEVYKILEYCHNNNIKHIDTARAYGNSEEILGRFDLSDFFISSKFYISDEFPSVRSNIEKSISTLKIPNLYAYLAHDAEQLINCPALWDQLLELKGENKVERIGYSLYKPDHLKELLDKGSFPDIIQVPFNVLDRRFDSFFPDLKAAGCEIHTRSAFLQGLFFIDSKILDKHFEIIKPVIEYLQNLHKNKEQLAAYLLQFCLQNKNIDKVVFGVNTLAQLQKNIAELSNSLFSINTDFLDIKMKIPESILLPNQWPKHKYE